MGQNRLNLHEVNLPKDNEVSPVRPFLRTELFKSYGRTIIHGFFKMPPTLAPAIECFCAGKPGMAEAGAQRFPALARRPGTALRGYGASFDAGAGHFLAFLGFSKGYEDNSK
jgi:hypothetical protein